MKQENSSQTDQFSCLLWQQSLEKAPGAMLVTVPKGDGDQVAHASQKLRPLFGLEGVPAQGADAREFLSSILRTMDRPMQLRADLDRFWGDSREERTDFLKQISPETRTIERLTFPLLSPDGAVIGRLWIFRVASPEFEHRNTAKRMRQRMLALRDVTHHLQVGTDTKTLDTICHRMAVELLAEGATIIRSLDQNPETNEDLSDFERNSAGPLLSESLIRNIIWPVVQLRGQGEICHLEVAELPDGEAARLETAGVKSLAVAPLRCKARLRGALVLSFPSQQATLTRDDERFIQAVCSTLTLWCLNRQLMDSLHDTRFSSAAVEEARTSLVSLLSHELRTPLNPLIGFTQLLQESSDDLSPETKDMVDRIAAGAQRLQDLVEDLLTLTRLDSRMAAWRRYACDPKAILEDAVAYGRTTAGNKKVEIILTIPDSLGVVDADGAALRRAVRSLVSNASRYSPDGGTVRVVAEEVNGFMRIAVEDQGPGIPEDQREVIFEPFVQGEPVLTRRHGGAGIGLALVKRLAQSHGGFCGVQEAPGGGSRFFLAIPLKSSR